MTEAVKQVLLTPVSRMSWPKLVTAVAFKDAAGNTKGDPYFGSELLFSVDDLEKFQVLNEETEQFEFVDVRIIASQLAKKKWPDINVKEAVAANALHWPVHNGDTHADKKAAAGKNAEYYRDHRFIRVKAMEQYAPSLKFLKGKEKINLQRGIDADMEKAKALFTGGSYVFAEITGVANETAQGRYITFYLNSICFVKSGERFGGGGNLMDKYDGIQGGESDKDPTAGMGDDEIPF